jgi:hypothetical protein
MALAIARASAQALARVASVDLISRCDGLDHGVLEDEKAWQDCRLQERLATSGLAEYEADLYCNRVAAADEAESGVER